MASYVSDYIDSPQSLPVDLSTHWRLPKTHAVYIVHMPCGEVKYVGRAANMYMRWQPGQFVRDGHKCHLPSMRFGCRISWIESDRSSYKALERDLIAEIQPPWNSTGVRNENRDYEWRPNRLAESARWKDIGVSVTMDGLYENLSGVIAAEFSGIVF